MYRTIPLHKRCQSQPSSLNHLLKAQGSGCCRSIQLLAKKQDQHLVRYVNLPVHRRLFHCGRAPRNPWQRITVLWSATVSLIHPSFMLRRPRHCRRNPPLLYVAITWAGLGGMEHHLPIWFGFYVLTNTTYNVLVRMSMGCGRTSTLCVVDGTEYGSTSFSFRSHSQDASRDQIGSPYQVERQAAICFVCIDPVAPLPGKYG